MAKQQGTEEIYVGQVDIEGNIHVETPPMVQQSLATVGTTAVATQQEPLDLRGFEEVDLAGLTMPTAKLLQQMSPELTDESFADYGFKSGMIIHSLLLEKLEDEFIPLKIHEDKVCFIPRNDSDKVKLKARVAAVHGIELDDETMKSLFLCRAQDGKTGNRFGSCESCKLCEFNGNDKPLCNKNINVLALFKGQDMPVVIRFTNTSLKHGQQFKSVAFAAGTALFKRKYKLMSTKKTDKGNTWYEMSARPFGKTEEQDVPKAEALYNRFAAISYDIADEAPVQASQTVTEF